MDFFNRRKKKDVTTEMSFIDHLEELRWHLIRMVIAVVVCAIIVFIYSDYVVGEVLFGPTKADFISAKWMCSMGQSIGMGNSLCFPEVKAKFLETTMTGQFIASFTLAFIGGFILAFPYVFWEFWRFLKPAMKPSELKYAKGIVFWSSLLFFSGVSFAYFVLVPFTVNFPAANVASTGALQTPAEWSPFHVPSSPLSCEGTGGP